MMDKSLVGMGSVLEFLDGWAPLFLPILFYCLPNLPRTPGRAKGRIILALAAIVALAEASYWFDWMMLHIQPGITSVMKMMHRGPILEVVVSVTKSVIGFVPVAILFLGKRGFRNFDSEGAPQSD